MPLRGLIFDFDGLIVDTESAIISAWERIHHEDGRRADVAVLHACIGHVDVEGDIWRAYPDAHDRVALEARFQELARRRCLDAPPRPGVLELIYAARAAGLRLAVASNSKHRHVDGHLESRGLRGHFEATMCRDDVARGKPAPDVYFAALEKLGLRAHEAVAFEDSLPGHEAAAAAGLPVVVVPNPITTRDTFARAALRVDSMTEITLARLEALVGARG